MAYKKLGSRGWGMQYDGEPIYLVGYAQCKCCSKTIDAFLCESEARALLEELDWLIRSKKGLKEKVERLYDIKIPKLKLEWG